MSGERPTFGLGGASRGTSDVTTTLYYIKSLRGISNLSLQFEDLLVYGGASAQPHRYLFTLDFLFRLHRLLKVIHAVQAAVVGQDSICNLVVVGFLNRFSLLLYVKFLYWVEHIGYILFFTRVFTL